MRRAKFIRFRAGLDEGKRLIAASSIARGAVIFMLIILLQGIWLPLHGYSYDSTPFWAGIYMLPMSIGSFIFGPISGALSGRYGARGLTTLGMILGAASLVALTFLP